VRAYRKARRLAAKAGNPAARLAPGAKRQPGVAEAPDQADRPRTPRPEPAPSVYSRERRPGAIKTGFLFGFGFAAGTALFRLILILIFYGALAAFGYWAYSRYVAGVAM
jgi:hypothetical protein